MHEYHCARLSYIIQHRTVLIICPPNLQTIITAKMLSILWKRENSTRWNKSYKWRYSSHSGGLA